VTPGWLPDLLCLSEFGGSWDHYLRSLYAVFRRDFISSPPRFGNLPVGLKRHPIIEGREATFWHLISEGSQEAQRLPDFRRCERIAWPRAIIAQSDRQEVCVWENRRHGERRFCLWVEAAEYLVILAARKQHVLLWTAYPVVESHRKRKLRQEYEAARKKLMPSQG